MNYVLRLSPIQHLPVPLCQPLGLWDFLFFRMTVEDVVISFTGRTGPNVGCQIPTPQHSLNNYRTVSRKRTAQFQIAQWDIRYNTCCRHCSIEINFQNKLIISPDPFIVPISLAKFQVSDEYFVVDHSSELARAEEVDAIQIWDVHSPIDMSQYKAAIRAHPIYLPSSVGPTLNLKIEPVPWD